MFRFRRSVRVAGCCALSALTLTLAACGAAGNSSSQGSLEAGGDPTSGASSGSASGSARDGASPARSVSPDPAPQLPQGGRRIFPKYRVVAYYGTAGTDVLGVLGSKPPGKIVERLRRVAAKYEAPQRQAQIAFELIVTIADPMPGPDGDYSHHIDRSDVRRYVEVARRNDALVVLDIQPGRGDFLPAVKHWEEFLKQPHVGVALDSEWHMAPGQVPAQTVGQTRAEEINEVSAYLSKIVERHNLPNKLFLLHTFREDMLLNEEKIKQRPGLAMVQHLDGFGDQKLKISKYRKLQEPEQFHMGFKLFYDEDTNLFTPKEVLDLDPPPDYISYQ